MGKKGTKRKTRWRVLPIGEDGGSGSGNDDDALVPGNEHDCTGDHYGGSAGSYARATQQHQRGGGRRPTTNGTGGGGGYYNNKQHYHPRSYNNHEHHNGGQPLVTTEKHIFNEEEYTKITTPRQDVLFKKGYLGRKKPTVVTPDLDANLTPITDDGGGVHNEECLENEQQNGMVEDHQQYIYNGFVDQSGVYYINGSGYEMYDPYTGQITVIVGPHYGPNGGPPVLAAVPCQPVPLQPLEWFNPPGFLPYVTAPPSCNMQLQQPCRDRRKRYSTDSQNCSPQSSESTGPPGSPQESDEVTVNNTQCPPVYPPQTYVYPGYMFGAPMYNMNGVTVQSSPNQAPSSDVNAKRRKKKRRRRRRRNGVEDGSEESSSDEKEPEEEPTSLTSQESSLESDSKLSLSGEESNQQQLQPPQPPVPAVTAAPLFQAVAAPPPPPVAPLIESPPIKPPPVSSKPPPEVRLVNGHDKQEVCYNGNHQAVIVAPNQQEFERFEDFDKRAVEEEWITVKAKQPRKAENGGEKLTNGHAKVYNNRDGYVPRVNGVNGRDRQAKDKLYKNNYNGRPVDEKCAVPVRASRVGAGVKLTNGRVKPPAKMDGNEERKTSESSTEIETPPKPGRKERKKVTTPPPPPPPPPTPVQTLQATAKPFEMPSVSLRPEAFIKPVETVMLESKKDSLLAALTAASKVVVDVSTLPKTTRVFASQEIHSSMQKIPSLKDLSTKSIPKDDFKSGIDSTAEFLAAESVAAPPVAPPRRKKLRQSNKRLERAPTPGTTNDDDSLEESSSSSASSSSSQESEESVIECLSSGLNSPEVKNVSSSDDEIIYSGKLGVSEPEPVGKLAKPEEDLPEVSVPAEDITPIVREMARDIVDTVIDKAVEESSRLKQEERPITEAVTRWLRSQSPDVLAIPEENEEEEDDGASGEEDDEHGSKNLLGNPLPVPSVECVRRDEDDGGRRVANKYADNTEEKDYDDEDDMSTPSGEWDLWDVRQRTPDENKTPDNEGNTRYDPLANDTFAPVEGTLLESPGRCKTMCDPSISVAKYYMLGPLPEKTMSPIQDTDSDGSLEEYGKLQGPYKISLATELARLEQPLPKSWAVAPLNVERRCDCKCKCKEPVQDSGVESGDEGVVIGKRVFRRKVTGRLTGEGTPFPCGGICCIVQ